MKSMVMFHRFLYVYQRVLDMINKYMVISWYINGFPMKSMVDLSIVFCMFTRPGKSHSVPNRPSLSSGTSSPGLNHFSCSSACCHDTALPRVAWVNDNAPRRCRSASSARREAPERGTDPIFSIKTLELRHQNMGLSENRYIPNYSHLIGIMIINHWV